MTLRFVLSSGAPGRKGLHAFILNIHIILPHISQQNICSPLITVLCPLSGLWTQQTDHGRNIVWTHWASLLSLSLEDAKTSFTSLVFFLMGGRRRRRCRPVELLFSPTEKLPQSHGGLSHQMQSSQRPRRAGAQLTVSWLRCENSIWFKSSSTSSSLLTACHKGMTLWKHHK